MKTLTSLFALTLFLQSLIGCGSRVVDNNDPINPSPNPSVSASTTPDNTVDADISPTLETNNAVLAEVEKLEKAGTISNLEVRESFPVQISLTGPQSVIDKLKAMASGQMTDGDFSFEEISKVGISNVQTEKQMSISTEAEYNQLWKDHSSSTEGAPKVDFSTEMVLAVFMGEKSTGGFDIEITSIALKDDVLTVTYSETEPDPNGFQIQVITYPAHLIKIKKTDAKVVFTKK